MSYSVTISRSNNTSLVVDSKSQCQERTTLVVKNIPKKIYRNNMTGFFQKQYGAVAVKAFGRHRAMVQFRTAESALLAMHKIHQSEIENQVLSVEFLGKRKLCKNSSDVKINESETKSEQKTTEFLQELFATSSHHGFKSAPPPHLKYCYPKINRDILDNISIQLLSNSSFYTQVLHLMNRMNLEPPFLPKVSKFVPPGDLVDAQTQTNFDSNFLSSDESELADSDESPQLIIKRRKLNDANKIKSKIKKLLKTPKMSVVKKNNSENINSIFENNNNINVIRPKISVKISDKSFKEIIDIKKISESLLVPNKISDKRVLDMSKLIKDGKQESSSKSFETNLRDLDDNRIPENQLKELPIYKNYSRGEASNKLYIKNLAKDVNEIDLVKIFSLFCEHSDFEVKLMQQGRMKGQAFITFNENINLTIVKESLIKTNGYILKNKPMVVYFGKKS